MGRNTTLTDGQAKELEFYWQLAGDTLSDEQICWKTGISLGQLQGWLRRNVKPIGADGTPGPVGLRHIRARAKVSTMTGYLAKLNTVADVAQANGDFGTAANTWKWLLEKQFPLLYGPRTRQELDAQTTEPATVEVTATEPDDKKWEDKAQRQGQEADKAPLV